MKNANNHNPRIGTTILTLTLIVLLGLVLFWAVVNFDAIKASFNGTRLYTAQEVEQAYNEGVGDKSGLEAEVLDWISKYEQSESTNTQILTQIEQREQEIATLTAERNALKQSGTAQETRIIELNAQIEQLTSEKNALTAEYTELQNELQTSKAQYAKYVTLVNAVAGDNYIIAYYSNATYSTILIPKGEALGTKLPKAGTGYIGWHYGNVTILDDNIATFIPTEHMVLHKSVRNATTDIIPKGEM